MRPRKQRWAACSLNNGSQTVSLLSFFFFFKANLSDAIEWTAILFIVHKHKFMDDRASSKFTCLFYIHICDSIERARDCVVFNEMRNIIIDDKHAHKFKFKISLWTKAEEPELQWHTQHIFIVQNRRAFQYFTLTFGRYVPVFFSGGLTVWFFVFLLKPTNFLAYVNMNNEFYYVHMVLWCLKRWLLLLLASILI